MKALLALSAAFCLISIGILALRLSSALSSVSSETTSTLQAIRKDADDLKEMTNSTLFQVGDASHEVAEMAREQKGYWKQSAEQTTQALKKTNLVLDQLTLAINNVDASEASMAANVNQSLLAIPPILAQTQDTVSKAGLVIDSMNKVVQDPNIPATLAHVNEVSAHLDSMSQSLDVAVKRWTKPKPLWKSLVLGGLDSASKVAILAK